MNTIVSQSGRRILTFLLAAGLGVSSAMAQANRRAQERANQRQEARDRFVNDNQFVRQAHEYSQLELKLAHLAVQKAKDPEVEKIGHRIINEHTRADAELRKLAEQRNIELSKEIAERDAGTVQRLEKLEGEEFVRAYRNHLENDYRNAVDLFRDAARNARDEDVRQFASTYGNLFAEHATAMGFAQTGERVRDRERDRERDDRSAVRGRDTTSTLSRQDQQLIDRAWRRLAMQENAGQVAVTKFRGGGKNETYAHRIINENLDLTRELKQLAARKGVTLPEDVTRRQDQRVEELSKLSGEKFRDEFQQFMMQTHKATVDLFENGVKEARDEELREWMRKALTTAREHLNLTRSNFNVRE